MKKLTEAEKACIEVAKHMDESKSLLHSASLTKAYCIGKKLIAEAEKEDLRRAARTRCIEKIADCEDAGGSEVFYLDRNARIKSVPDRFPSVECALVCRNGNHAEKLCKDKQFCADYKLYLGVSDEA